MKKNLFRDVLQENNPQKRFFGERELEGVKRGEKVPESVSSGGAFR